MIVIDMPMPENCMNCPCSYWVTSGKYEGTMICNALEFRDRNDGLEDLSRFFVNETAARRPDNCPIRMEVIR